MPAKILPLLLLLLLPASLSAQPTISPLTDVVDQNGHRQSYQHLIESHHLSGLSLAVVDHYHLVFQTVAGEKRHGSGAMIDADTAFSAASMSKPVTATIAAMLAEQGKLSLDAPINQYLKRWHLPDSALNNGRPVTFRDLLTHTAGTSQSGFADFYQGDDIPSAIDSLNGKKLPRYHQPLHLTFAPGSDWNYSGGGYVLVQVALEDITGKPLAELAKEMIFQPLGMTHTTMLQPNQRGFLTDTAKVHDVHQKVIRSGLPICPQVAPSGMWSTPVDLSKFLIDYQLALAGKQSKAISPWVARETTRIYTLKRMGGWSAGWMRFEGYGNRQWFSHGGSNTGTGGTMMATMQGGKAVVILGNGPNPARIPVIRQLISSIIRQMHWTRPIPSANQQPDTALLKKMAGRYRAVDGKNEVTIQLADGQLTYDGAFVPWTYQRSGKLVYLGDQRFAAEGQANTLSAEVNPADNKTYLTFSRPGTGLKEYALVKLRGDDTSPH